MPTDKEFREAGGVMSDADLWVKLRREFPQASEEEIALLVREAEEKGKGVKAQMSDQETLQISDHLNQRRLEYGIIDGAFASMPTDDRVFVYQVDLVESDKFYEGGVLTRPDALVDAGKRQSCRGVLCSWGLKAQDELVPYDYRLGDMVRFIQMAPWRMVIGSLGGKEESVLVLRAGHMIANDDAEKRRRSGETTSAAYDIQVSGDELVSLRKHRIMTSVAEYNRSIGAKEDHKAFLEINQPVVMEEY